MFSPVVTDLRSGNTVPETVEVQFKHHFALHFFTLQDVTNIISLAALSFFCLHFIKVQLASSDSDKCQV